MELYNFFDIFCVHKKLFWGIILVSVVCGALYFLLQEQNYKTSLVLNVTRDVSNVQQNEYTYDDFYRLQADERFADTVVQWIKSPFIRAEIKNVQGKMTAKRLSSQVIDVRFTTATRAHAETVAHDLIDVLNQESHKLNDKQAQDHWFIIQGSTPTVTDGRYTLFFLTGLSGALGFFVAFWAVLLRHYVNGFRK